MTSLCCIQEHGVAVSGGNNIALLLLPDLLFPYLCFLSSLTRSSLTFSPLTLTSLTLSLLALFLLPYLLLVVPSLTLSSLILASLSCCNTTTQANSGCTEGFGRSEGAVSEGSRVKRGPDWKWSNQDGGVGSFGTVLQVITMSNILYSSPSPVIANF